MKVVVHCNSKTESFPVSMLDINYLSSNQKENKVRNKDNKDYYTLYSHLKKKLVPSIISTDAEFNSLINTLKQLNLVEFGNIISGKSSVDITNYPNINPNLSHLIDNNLVYPNIAFLNIPDYQNTGTPKVERAGSFDIINGIYLKNSHVTTIIKGSVYYPCMWYYKTNTTTNELEIHISYVTNMNKL